MSTRAQGAGLSPGILLAFWSALLFGLSAPLAKLLLGVVDPWMLAGLLYLGSGAGLTVAMLVRRRFGRPSSEASLTRSDIPVLIAVLTFGGIAGPVLLMFGLQQTSASSASLLLNLEGLATMAIAWLVFRENVDPRLFVGAAAILAGAVILSWKGSSFELEPGGLLIAAACLAWGIDNNLSRKLSARDPLQVAAVKGLVAGSANTGIALAVGASIPALGVAAGAAVLGLFSIGLSLVLFMLALRHLGAARTGAYYSLAPFIGAIVGIVALRETPTLALGAAAVLMAIGVWLHVTERHEHEHLHEAIEHEHAHVHDAHHQHTHDGDVIDPHSHWHRHEPVRHSHAHYPDLHHGHRHEH